MNHSPCHPYIWFRVVNHLSPTIKTPRADLQALPLLHTQNPLEWLRHHFWSPRKRNDYKYWGQARLDLTSLQVEKSLPAQDHIARRVFRWTSRQMSTKEGILQGLPSPMVHSGRVSRLLASHHQVCCFLLWKFKTALNDERLRKRTQQHKAIEP